MPLPPRAFTALVCAALLIMAGCTGFPDANPGDAAEDDGAQQGDRFPLVVIQGNETHDPSPAEACDVAFDHRVDREEQRVVYNDHRYDLDEVVFLVAIDHFVTTSDCPLAYELREGLDVFTVEVGNFGNLTVRPQANGTVMLEPGEGSAGQDTNTGEPITLAEGDDHRFTYEQTIEDRDGEEVNVTGSFLVEHLASYPASGLEAR